MSPNPTFAELVIYLLPEHEQSNGEACPGPRTSVLDEYHYRLLSEHLECDKRKLRAAWREWLRIGKYKHGESQQKTLLDTTKPFGKHIAVYEDIQRGLNGTLEEQELFRREWLAKGIEEAKKDVHWDIWSDVRDLNNGCQEPTRMRQLGLHHPEATADDFLGPKIY